MGHPAVGFAGATLTAVGTGLTIPSAGVGLISIGVSVGTAAALVEAAPVILTVGAVGLLGWAAFCQ
jgi:hypothetical protein